MNIVKVEWLDSETRGAGWLDKDDFDAFARDAIAPCVSAGFLWLDTPEHVVLVLSISRDCIDGHMKIPKAAIVSLTTIVEADTPQTEA